ncbi:hypothetical protein ABIA33_007146 [Streptacidiphilus sp. MAP12-16]
MAGLVRGRNWMGRLLELTRAEFHAQRALVDHCDRRIDTSY